MEHLDEALALAPEDPELHAMRSMSLLELGRHDSADEASREAMAENPEEARVLLSRGLVCMSQGDVREAETLFRAAVAQHPNEPVYRHSLLVARIAGRPVSGPVFRRLMGLRSALGPWVMIGLFVMLLGLAVLRTTMPEHQDGLSLTAAGVLVLHAALMVLPEVLLACAPWLFRERHLDGVESASVAVSAGNHALMVLVGALFWVGGSRLLCALPICLAPMLAFVGPRSERSVAATPRQRVTHQWLSLAASLVFTLHLASGLPHIWLSLLPVLYFFFTKY